MSKYFIRQLDHSVELWSTIRGWVAGQEEETLLELSNFVETFAHSDHLADGEITQEWNLWYTGEFHFFGSTPYFFYQTGRNQKI